MTADPPLFSSCSNFRGDTDSIQIGTLFSYWVISGAVDLGFQLNLYGWKDKK
jgi:hypothetical protein